MNNLPDILSHAPLLPLWQMNIVELTGHNIEAEGRTKVNELLRNGWILLHLYTLLYEENGVWRQRPMAILGRQSSSIFAKKPGEFLPQREKRCIQIGHDSPP